MEVKAKDLWVFVETNPDGSAKNVGIELLTPGRLMADKQGGDLVAVVLGKDVSAAVKEINEHGADQIIVVEGPEFEEYTTDAYTTALVELIEKYAPTSVLMILTKMLTLFICVRQTILQARYIQKNSLPNG